MPLRVQRYERYLPNAFDESLTLLEKVNKMIEHMNQVGELTNEVVEQWNEVMEWVMNDGLTVAVNNRLDQMVEDGTLDEIINHKIFADLNDKIDSGLNQINNKVESIIKPFESDINNSQARNSFIAEMNNKAKQFQMNDTNFENPHGIHNSNQYSNAFDMMLLGMKTTGYPELMSILGKRNYVSTIEGSRNRKINVETTVDISSINDTHILVGAKTGSITLDGDRIQNLIAFGQPKKESSFFVSAVMNVTPSRYTATRHLWDIAQSSMKSKFDFKYHTNNLTNGNFDEGFDGWTVNGSPIFDRQEYFTYPQSVNVGSSGTSNYVSRTIATIPGNVYYVCAYVKCNRHEAGYIGLQISGSGVETKNDRISRTTRGWSKRSIRFVAETDRAVINVGGMESANLDGWIDGVNVINLTSAYGEGSEPSKQYMDSEQWRNISGGSDGAGVVSQVTPASNSYDRETIEVLFNKNGTIKYPPASLTKLMTAILTVENEKDLERKIVITNSDISGGSGSEFYSGDILTINDALHHLLLESSNTVANALARSIGKKMILFNELGIR